MMQWWSAGIALIDTRAASGGRTAIRAKSADGALYGAPHLASAPLAHTCCRRWRTSLWRSSIACECACALGVISHSIRSAGQPGVTGVVCADSHGLLLHSKGDKMSTYRCQMMMDTRQGQWRWEERRSLYSGHPACQGTCNGFCSCANSHDRV